MGERGERASPSGFTEVVLDSSSGLGTMLRNSLLRDFEGNDVEPSLLSGGRNLEVDGEIAFEGSLESEEWWGEPSECSEAIRMRICSSC